ncbi:hypothetical protein SCHPADRAFT_911842 [Schizopora paradoxa]|uniref:Uncharacterized protein n=1 Tax=Schizopora paradoxa TaxID=27342 RepID=A0A0H2QYQ2_9AGAM|nr:hypothetical protein SCHPADRAFT_911842 [Schizopora paradoxa]
MIPNVVTVPVLSGLAMEPGRVLAVSKHCAAIIATIYKDAPHRPLKYVSQLHASSPSVGVTVRSIESASERRGLHESGLLRDWFYRRA